MTHDRPDDIRIEKNLLIPLGDGVSLAADLYAPHGEGPFPTLISYYPYHKDDVIGAMLEYPRRYFVAHGYAHLLVDLRGLGNSSGVAWETLDAREAEDAAEIVEWAARQAWCDGNVGMWGLSYGGVTTLHAASQRPPHLKAIVPIQCPVDVYHELLCRLACLPYYGNWGTWMVGMNLMPPGYQDAQGRWEEVWKERLETGYPHIFAVLDHPTFDEYWQSKVIPVENITVPTFMIGSWWDVLPNSMFKIYEAVSAPKKLVMGPWTHILPDHFPFEPWDYLHEMKRWWDYWLKGEKNDVLDEPPVTIFVQGSDTWRHEREWPIQRSGERRLSLSGGRTLADGTPEREGSDPYQTNPTVGAMAGLFDGVGLGIGTPLDQGPDDLQSLTYTTEPLAEDVEVTGAPEATLCVALESGDDVNLVAKLTDVGPDGSSTLITLGSIKGSTYFSDEHPAPLESGKVYQFRIPLCNTSYLVAKGHRLRLSVSCADFPRLWPTPTNPEIRLFFGGAHDSSLRLPVVPPAADPAPKPEIRRPDPTVNRAPLAMEGVPRWKIEQDLIAGKLAVTTGARQQMLIPSGGKMLMDTTITASVSADRPDSAKIEGEGVVRLELPAAGLVEVESQTLISRTRVLLAGKVTVNGQLFFEKRWQR